MSKSHSSVQITITGHKRDDREYLIGRVRPMFAELFDMILKVLLVKDENTMILHVLSKRVALTSTSGECPLAGRNYPI